MKSKWMKSIGVLCMLHACLVSAAEQKPSVLWITGEDMSAKWLGCYGNKQIKTPNFDKLAAEGFLYTHCFAHAPVCAPARALGPKTKVVRIRNAKESRELPTPYGVFSIIYDGKLIAERPISATRFLNIMRKHEGQSPAGDVLKAAPEE